MGEKPKLTSGLLIRSGIHKLRDNFLLHCPKNIILVLIANQAFNFKLNSEGNRTCLKMQGDSV